MKSFAPLSRMRQRNEISKREQHVCAGEGYPNVRASWRGRLWLPYGERMQESKVALILSAVVLRTPKVEQYFCLTLVLMHVKQIRPATRIIV
jgi:hypothetical protein